MMRKLLILIAVVSLAMLQLDCATKKSVKKEVDRIDKEMDDMGNLVEEGQTRNKEQDSRLGTHDQQITHFPKSHRKLLHVLKVQKN